MGYHHKIILRIPFLDHGLKGYKIHRSQLLLPRLDTISIHMGIHPAPAQSRKMLQAVQDSLLLKALCRIAHKISDHLGICTVGTGIRRAHIRHRRKIDIETDSLEFLAGTDSPFPGSLRLASGPQ